MAARLLLVMLFASPLAGLGCRACQSCYDYSSPVAGYDCNGGSCGSGRTGSRSAGAVMHDEPVYDEYETVTPTHP